VADTKTKMRGLDLEVEEVERFACVGCGTSSTSPHCTCPVMPSTTGSLFTAKATR
jgi:hypothetical protein